MVKAVKQNAMAEAGGIWGGVPGLQTKNSTKAVKQKNYR